jgi:hypothetical protein
MTKQYIIVNNLQKGGWIKEEDKNKCLVTGNPIIKRLYSDINSYKDYDFSFDPIENIVYSDIHTTNFNLKFKIIIEKCDKIHNIGSFIRSAVRLLVNYNPKNLLFVLDLSKCQDILVNLKKNINLLINSSTTAIIFTNVYLLFDERTYGLDKYLKMKDELKNTCISICNLEECDKLLNSEPFYINLDSLSKSNLFNNFNSSKQHILITHKNVDVTTFYSPIIHNIASYSIEYLSQDKNRTFLICIEKLPNLLRLYALFLRFNLLDNLIVILPNSYNKEEHNSYNKEEHDSLNICNIIDQCKANNIKYKNISDTVDLLKSVYDKNNIVAVDLHKDAYIYKYGDKVDKLNNSFVIFGFESTGIPKDMLDYCKFYLQLEARSSINVVATVSILLASLY